MTVYYTSNELRSEIPRLLEIHKVPNLRRELKVGDYFCGTISQDGSYLGVPVERKSIGDYFASINDGRRDEQLYHLSYNFPLSFIVVIGSPSRILESTRSSLGAYVSSLVGSSLKRAPDGVKGQVVTVNVEEETQFVLFVKYLDEKICEGDLVRLPSIQKRARGSEEVQVYVVSSLPGVGTKNASNLLRRFGSVRGVMNASVAELQEVPGIGPKRAKEIHSVATAAFPSEEGSIPTKGSDGEVLGR